MARLLGVPPKAPSASGVGYLGPPVTPPPAATGGGGPAFLGIPPVAPPSGGPAFLGIPPQAPPGGAIVGHSYNDQNILSPGTLAEMAARGPRFLGPPVHPGPRFLGPPIHPGATLIPPVRRLMQAILAMHYGVNPPATTGY